MTAKLDFSGFTGTENYYRTSFLPYFLTDGAMYAVQAMSAFWLADAIASHLVAIPADEWFVVANLTQQKDGSALLTLDDGDKGSGALILASQHIESTDFAFERWPEQRVRFFCSRTQDEHGKPVWVIMLPEEY